MDSIWIRAVKIIIAFSLPFLLLLLFPNDGSCGAFVDEMQCATLFSEDHLEGDTFFLSHFDQSMNLKKDYRASLLGWENTSSIRVEENCAVNICTQTYLQGDCKTLQTGYYEASNLISPIKSASCLCTRECRCQDIVIPRNPVACGRAYLQGGCNTCDSKYLQLHCKGNVMLSSAKYKDVFESIVLRKGCKITIFTEYRWKGTSQVFNTAITENYNGPIASYKIRCDDDAYLATFYKDAYVLLNKEGYLAKLLSSNETHVTVRSDAYPPIVSLETRRAQKNAYILFLGALNPIAIGFDCKEAKNKIGECRVPLEIDDLGFYNPQLRLIYTPFPQGGPDNDAKIAASLDEHLTNHEELTNAIPNAIIIYFANLTDANFPQKGSTFQRLISIVNSLRLKVLDENFSNLVLLLDKLGSLPSPMRKNPEKKIAEFEKAILDNWSLPKPINIVPGDTVRTKINGYWKIQNEEYFPKNLKDQLMLIAERSGDDIGRVVFKSAFPEETARSAIMWTKVFDLVANTHQKIEVYKQSLANPVSVPVKTQLSVLAQKRQVKICCNVLYSMKMTSNENCELQQKFDEFQDQLTQIQEAADAKLLEMKEDFQKQIQEIKSKAVDAPKVEAQSNAGKEQELTNEINELKSKLEKCSSGGNKELDFISQIKDLQSKLAVTHTHEPQKECESNSSKEQELIQEIKELKAKLAESQTQKPPSECGTNTKDEKDLKQQINDLSKKLEDEQQARDEWMFKGNEIPDIQKVSEMIDSKVTNEVSDMKETSDGREPTDTKKDSEKTTETEIKESPEKTEPPSPNEPSQPIEANGTNEDQVVKEEPETPTPAPES